MRHSRHVLIGLLIIMSCAVLFAQSPVDMSVHNLSPLGPSGRNYTSTDQNTAACIFCHVPHGTNASTPMWNKPLPAGTPDSYTSSTFVQQNNPISERSKLCLSCHDGTIALGQTVANGNLGLASKMSGANVVGATTLKADHPISFNLPAVDDGEIASWLRTAPMVSPDPAIQTYDNKIECRTCHDPHVPDNDKQVKKFLVRANDNSAMCTTCHDTNRGILTNYLAGAHSNATSNGVLGNAFPYDTVAKNSCVSCHTSHNSANAGVRLLRANEETTCAPCHSSPSSINPAAPDVFTSLTSALYKHPITTLTGAHDAAETLPISNNRHSECQDCHNPHAARTNAAAGVVTPPAVQAAATGTSGISIAGAVLTSVSFEYEICLKCHGSSTNKPQALAFAAYGRTILRDSMVGTPDPFNKALQFQSTISRHNVAQSRSGYSSPSLRTAMANMSGVENGRSLASGNIYCSDCHNSDAARSTTGSGNSANGPHSSKWPHLLERRYDVNTPPATPGDNTDQIPYAAGSSGPYGMCDKCHDVAGKLINGGDTVFGRHQRHVVRGGISCSSCHNPHGVQGSDATHHGGLMDIDAVMAKRQDNTPFTTPAAPNPNVGVNTTTRSCSLTCHGHQHNNKKY